MCKMEKNGRIYTAYFGVILVVIQFLIIPFLGSVSFGAKGYAFVVSTLIAVFFFFKDVTEIRFSRMLLPLGLAWVFFLLAAYFAFSSMEAFLAAGFFGVGLIFLLMMVHLVGAVPGFALRIMDALLIAGVVAASLGLYEYFHFLRFGQSHEMLIPFLLPPDLSYRVYGVYGQPNLFALFLNFCLLAFFFRYLHGPIDSGSRKHQLRFLPVVMVSLVMFLTASRAGMISLFLALSTLGWLVASGRYLVKDKVKKKEFVYLLICLAAAFLVYKFLHVAGPGKDDVARNFAGISIGTDGRFVFWMSSLLLFIDHPFLGVGLNNFQYLLPSKVLQSHDILGFVEYEAMAVTRWSHNEFLQILCEGGIFPTAIIFIIFLVFLIQFWKNIIKNKNIQGTPLFLYSHILLLPFIFQSMLSWPLRYPPLFCVFLFVTGVLLAQYKCENVKISCNFNRLFRCLALACLGFSLVLIVQEVKLGKFFQEIHRSQGGEHTLAPFYGFCENMYSETRVLEKSLPIYVKRVVGDKNRQLASDLIPYAERLVALKGAGRYWYILGLLQYTSGDEDRAVDALRHAIELRPFDNRYWNFYHYLNMLSAARKTGRPIEDFISSKADHKILIPEFLDD